MCLLYIVIKVHFFAFSNKKYESVTKNKGKHIGVYQL